VPILLVLNCEYDCQQKDEEDAKTFQVWSNKQGNEQKCRCQEKESDGQRNCKAETIPRDQACKEEVVFEKQTLEEDICDEQNLTEETISQEQTCKEAVSEEQTCTAANLKDKENTEESREKGTRQ